MAEPQIAEELGRFALVSSHQPFSERRMEEHVGVVQTFHEESREHFESLQKILPCMHATKSILANELSFGSNDKLLQRN